MIHLKYYKTKKNIGLFGGTFDPVHSGHLRVSNRAISILELDEIWWIVSLSNPLRINKISDFEERVSNAKKIVSNSRVYVSDIEKKLNTSFTIDILTYLKREFPKTNFVWIMGADNLVYIDKWKNAELILSDYHLLVYPRPGVNKESLRKHPHIHFIEAPVMEISSSFIRKAIADGKDVCHFLPQKTWKYIDEMSFYK